MKFFERLKEVVLKAKYETHFFILPTHPERLLVESRKILIQLDLVFIKVEVLE